MRFRSSSGHTRKRLDIIIQAYEGIGCRRKLIDFGFGNSNSKLEIIGGLSMFFQPL